MNFNDRQSFRQGHFVRPPRNEFIPPSLLPPADWRLEERPAVAGRFDDRPPVGGFRGGPRPAYETGGSARPVERVGPIEHGPTRQFEHGAARPFEHGAARPFEHGAARPFEHGATRPFEHGAAKPFEQEGPTRPFKRDDLARPFKRDDPVRPFERLDPARPFERLDPARPFERLDPARPFERLDPARPFERGDLARPFERGDPARQFERGDPARPFERLDPARPFERLDPARPFERGDPAKPFKHDDSARPFERDSLQQRGSERSAIGAMAPRTNPPRNDLRVEVSPPAAKVGQPTLQSTRTNDVEIIVTNKSLTHYAESIEYRLRNVGMTVDLLFPNEEVSLERLLGNIAGRGTLIGLVVSKLNEQNRTVTVDVLFGETQEHRNMPLDDALAMIVRIYEAYMDGKPVLVEPALGAVAVTSDGFPLGNRHPDGIQNILKLLLKNQALTVYEYNQLIGYLVTKRDNAAQLDRESAKGDVAPDPVKPQAPTSTMLNASIKKAIQDIVHSNHPKGGSGVNLPRLYGPRN